MAVVLSGCQCWSPKGRRREKGEAGALLFEVSCPLCCSRPSLGPPDDLSSCSFEGQYAPRGPDTRTNKTLMTMMITIIILITMAIMMTKMLLLLLPIMMTMTTMMMVIMIIMMMTTTTATRL